jgi:hypothetical protein
MITRRTRGAPFDNRDDDFFRISRWGCAVLVGEEKIMSSRVPNSVANSPPTQFTFPRERGVRSATLIRGLVIMGPAYPPDRKQEFRDELEYLNESPLHDEDYADDDHSDGVTSLLEENARLRALVVRLTGLVLKSVAERG